MTVKIRGWYTRLPKGTSAYTAPELAGIAVAGEVHGHPKKQDGLRVTTSRVVRVSGRKFWTESGTAYELEGEPDPRFIATLEAQGRAYIPELPFSNVRAGAPSLRVVR